MPIDFGKVRKSNTPITQLNISSPNAGKIDFTKVRRIGSSKQTEPIQQPNATDKLFKKSEPVGTYAETDHPDKKFFDLGELKEYVKDYGKSLPWYLQPLAPNLSFSTYFLKAPLRLPFFDRTVSQSANTLVGDEVAKKADVGKVGNVVADVGGTLLGYGTRLPGGGGTSMLNGTDATAQYLADKAAAKGASLLPKVFKSASNPTIYGIAEKGLTKVMPAYVRGASDAALGAVIEGTSTGMKPEDIAKKAVLEGSVGGVLGLGFEGLKSLKKLIKPDTPSEVVEAFTKAEEAQKIIKSQPLQGKFKVKNVAYEKAMQDYEEAVKKIQDYYGTEDIQKAISNIDSQNTGEISQMYDEGTLTRKKAKDAVRQGNLTKEDYEIVEALYPTYVQKYNLKKPVEVPLLERVKKDTNVDIEALTNNLEKTSNPVDLKLIALKQRLKYAAGVEELPANKLQVPQFNKPMQEIAATVEPMTQSGVKFVTSANKKPFNFKDTWNKFYTRVIDSNRPIQNVSKVTGDNTYTLATNSKNVGGTVDYIMQEGLVNKQGKKIGQSLKQVVEQIPKGQEDDFWNYMGHRHNIDRAAQGKNVFPDFDSAASANAAKTIEQLHPEYKKIGDNIVKFINDFMDEWGNKSGLIDNETWNKLREMYPNYFPTHRSFDELEKGVSNVFTNSKGFVDQTTPLRTAIGSERNIINPVENIMNLINTTVRKAKYNEVGQSLLEAVRKNPEALSKYAEIIEKPANLDNIVTVLEGGEPVYLKINDKSLLESLEGMYKNNDGAITQAARKVTGIYKGLITQKNPVFAIRNIARDIPTAYVYGSEKNPVKFLSDLLVASKDLAKKTDIAQQYKALGGGGSNFFNSGNVAKSANALTNKSMLNKIADAIEEFNNLTESAPRLAEFKRTLAKTGDEQKALFAAADVTTNFSRGGDITKSLDAYVPYLNAGVQGLDKLVRQFYNKPIATVLKGATIVTAPTLILNAINKDNPNYQQLDNRTKDNYYLIPNGDTFIKIPKSRELGVLFGALTERILRSYSGDTKAFAGFKETLGTNFSPSNPIENNILSPLAYNIPKNQDFAGRAIVPENMKDRSPKLQYDEATSEISKAIGEMSNISPKQIDYLIKSYTGVIGQLLLPATTEKNKKSLISPITSQFVADPLYNNNEITDFYNNYEELKRKAADRNFTGNLPSKLLTKEEALRNKFAAAQKAMSEITKQIKKAEQEKDTEKVRQLRRKIIDIASKTNKLIK